MPRVHEEDDYVDGLLNEGTSFKVILPQKLYARLLALGRRRFGNLDKNIIIERAVIYAAALGTLPWAEHYSPIKRRRVIKAKHRTNVKGAPAVGIPDEVVA